MRADPAYGGIGSHVEMEENASFACAVVLLREVQIGELGADLIERGDDRA